MGFQQSMWFEDGRVPSEGYDFAGADKDIVAMQGVVEIIREEANIHSWYSIVKLLDSVTNALQKALNESRKCEAGWAEEEAERIEAEKADSPAGQLALEEAEQQSWREQDAKDRAKGDKS